MITASSSGFERTSSIKSTITGIASSFNPRVVTAGVRITSYNVCYTKLLREKNVIRFTSTALVSLSKNIDEVSVYAHLLTGTMDDDKTVYNVTPEAAEVATSALELLRQVPEVTVDYITNDRNNFV